MIVFPNAKINLGLDIIRRRSDGYHEIASLMLPVQWCDILEIVPSRSGSTTLSVSGRAVNCPAEKNLVMKACRALAQRVPLPAVDIYLHKVIPDGAGLGGGSSDAAFTIKTLNDMFALGLTDNVLAEISAEIGADCPFFIYDRPMLAAGTGTSLTPIDIDLDGITIAIAKPPVCISTAEAYAGVTPTGVESRLQLLPKMPRARWQDVAVNGFEESLLDKYPQISHTKAAMTRCGAFYTSLSGSGSAVFGMFEKNDNLAERLPTLLTGFDIYVGK